MTRYQLGRRNCKLFAAEIVELATVSLPETPIPIGEVDGNDLTPEGQEYAAELETLLAGCDVRYQVVSWAPFVYPHYRIIISPRYLEHAHLVIDRPLDQYWLVTGDVNRLHEGFLIPTLLSTPNDSTKRFILDLARCAEYIYPDGFAEYETTNIPTP